MFIAPKELKAKYPLIESQRSRPSIWPSDTFTVVYEARQRKQTSTVAAIGDLGDGPATVSSAYVRLRNDSSTEFIEIGGVGVYTDECDIEPGDGTRIGDAVSYKLSGAFTTQAGNYVLYITATFDDQTKVTESLKFRVLEFQ